MDCRAVLFLCLGLVTSQSGEEGRRAALAQTPGCDGKGEASDQGRLRGGLGLPGQQHGEPAVSAGVGESQAVGPGGSSGQRLRWGSGPLPTEGAREPLCWMKRMEKVPRRQTSTNPAE